MEQGKDLEQIARDPLAIFDWFTCMVLDQVRNDPAFAGRYQGQLERTPRLRALLESAPSRTDQYEWLRGLMGMSADTYGGNVAIMVEKIRGHMDNAEKKYN